MEVTDHGLLTDLKRSALNATDTDTANIIVVVDGRDQQLQLAVLVTIGSGNVVDDGIE